MPWTRVVSLLVAAVALTTLGASLPGHPTAPDGGAPAVGVPAAGAGRRIKAGAAVPAPRSERMPTPPASTAGSMPLDPASATANHNTTAEATTSAAGDRPRRAGDSPRWAGDRPRRAGDRPTWAGDSSGPVAAGARPATSGRRTAPAPLRKTVALTFDDGPSPYTPKILDILRREHVPATFCMVGDEARRYPAYARMVVHDGHRLCNHSRDHADLARLSATAARREVTAGEREIRDAAGVAPRLFRFPYGSVNATARTAVDGYGLHPLFWDVDPRDWTRPAASTITSRILAQVRPGAVVLMHDGGGDRGHTVASLEATITGLRDRGYQFVPADGVDPGE